jgi:DNA-binding transcriptional regulator GbsR (MarR family)
MTWFKATPSKQPQPYRAEPVRSYSTRGDRSLALRVEEAEPESKKQKNIERGPRGCLFKVGTGFFDLDGFWCQKKRDRQVEISRTAPRKVMAQLTNAQKRELSNVRQNAKRNGIR